MKVSLVIDCADPDKLAEFWTVALGCEARRFTDELTLLMLGADLGPRILLQKVPEPKTVKNRLHIDLDVSDIEAEAARVESLGAKRVSDVMTMGPARWIVMNDPEANEFCVCLDLGL